MLVGHADPYGEEARRGRGRNLFFLMMSKSLTLYRAESRVLLLTHARAPPVLILWENTSYRMAEEQRRRNASRRKHVDVQQNALPPRMIGNAGGVNLDKGSASIAAACRRHGLVPQPWVQASVGTSPRRPRVFDVMLLDGPELEVLEVRLHELSSSVDRFILVEGRRTVNGKRKPTFFAEHRETQRFAQYRQKLLHYEIPELAYTKEGRPIHNSEIDVLHRNEMRAALRLAGVQPGDVVVAGNANEIPSASTVGLFVACEGWPSNATTVGLLLEPFVFSFELGVHSEPVGGSFGELSRVSTYTEDLQSAAFSRKSIGRRESGGAGPVMIRDAGWKCTCCFLAVADYIDHCQDMLTNFRFGSDANRRDAQLVQRVLCGGKAEGAVTGAGSGQTHSSAQNLRAGGEMPGKERWGRSAGLPAALPLHRKHGTGGVPVWLGEQAESNDVPALFLLPGHCERLAVTPPPPVTTVAAAQPQATAFPNPTVEEKPQKKDGDDSGATAKHAGLPAVVGLATVASGKGDAGNPSVADAQLGRSDRPAEEAHGTLDPTAAVAAAAPSAAPSAASLTSTVADKPVAASPMNTKPVPSSRGDPPEEPQAHATRDISATAQTAMKQRVKKGHGRDR